MTENKVESDYELKNVLNTVMNTAVRDIPAVFKDDCKKIILYGSCARGDYTDDSDVDIAILTDSDREQVKKYNAQIDDIAAKISIATMAIVNFVCLPIKEFEEKKSWYPYFKNIAKEGVLLYER